MEQLTKASADYSQKSTNPNDKCSQCIHFSEPYSCEQVQGIIMPMGWCRFFAPDLKANLRSMMES